MTPMRSEHAANSRYVRRRQQVAWFSAIQTAWSKQRCSLYLHQQRMPNTSAGTHVLKAKYLFIAYLMTLMLQRVECYGHLCMIKVKNIIKEAILN